MFNKFGIFLVMMVTLIACQRGGDIHRYTSVVEGKTVDVPAMVGGKIVAMRAETGQAVHKGQFIARVDTVELHWQKMQVIAGLQEIASQRITLQVQAQRAAADLSYARQRLHRTEKLFQENTVPQQTLDDVRNRFQQAESAYRAAAAQLKALHAREAKLRAQWQVINKKLADASVFAPVEGIVTAKYVEQGEAVAPMAPIVEITSLDTVWVKIYVSQPQLSSVKPGTTATIFVDGYSKTLQGKIVWISPQAEFTPKNILTPETRTSLVYAVKVQIPNPEGLLKIGMPVEVEL